MVFLRIIFAIGFNIIFGYFCSGTRGDKGLLIGLWNPASIIAFLEIPTNSESSFKFVNYSLQRSSNQIISLTSDPINGDIFAAVDDSIYIYRNLSIQNNRSIIFSLLYKGRSLMLGKMAIDYVSKNLYWCDSLLQWIVMRPVYNTNNKIYKVVVQKDLKYPEGLAIDSENRLMFFSDNGQNPRIEKASLDGQNREVIVFIGLLKVISLSVDILNKKLYWSDEGRYTLEVSDYDGANRKVIIYRNFYPYADIFYHQNLLHVVTSKKKQFDGIDVLTGSVLYSKRFISVTAKPYTVTVYDAETRGLYNDSCSSLTCDHMCVNTNSGPRCLCSEGFQVGADGKSCTDKYQFYDKGFIVNNGSTLAMHEVNSVNGQTGVHILMQNTSFMIESIAVDVRAHVIYFVDSKSNSIKKFDMITEQLGTLTYVSPDSELTLDWNSNLIGWIEAKTNVISFSVNSGTVARIYQNLQHVKSLTVDSHHGDLFWISGIPGSMSIARGTWTRETPNILVSAANLNDPRSLKYDVISHRLYWLDGSFIKSSTTNGSDIKRHITVEAKKVFAYKGFFGWINGDKLYFARQTSTKSENILNTLQNIKNVGVFDSTKQHNMQGTCHILNGGCEDICIPLAIGRRCECDLGLQLQEDFTCDSDGLVLKDFIIIADYFHGRILQISLQTGSVSTLPITVNNAFGIAFDKLTQTVIYSETNAKRIMYTTIHGQNTSFLYNTGAAYASRLAIDFSTGNVYYTGLPGNHSQSYIGVIRRTTKLHKTLLFNLDHPRGIALYPSKGLLFWAELGSKPAIRRASMDGTSTVSLVTKDLKLATGIAIDFKLNKLYWVDGGTNRVELSDLDGGNRHVLKTDTQAYLQSICIHGEYLYYTGWNKQRITKLDKTTGSEIPFMDLHPEFSRLDGMDIYADDIIDVSITCSILNGLCSTFCFPTPSGRTCGCQDNVALQSDQLTCQGVTLCPSLLDNAVLSPDCTRRPGDSCSFLCSHGYHPSISDDLTCTSNGTWNNNVTTICSLAVCQSSLENAALSPNCSRRPGDSCSFSCSEGYQHLLSDNLTCTSNGTWSTNITRLCKKRKLIQGDKENNIYLYIGLASGVVIVIAAVAIVIVFLLKRRNTERSGETFGGPEYITPLSGTETCQSSKESYYCTISQL